MVHLVYCDNAGKAGERVIDKIEDVLVGTSKSYNYENSKLR